METWGTVIATRAFTAEDQSRFADWSGDFNPMHMDSLAARRTQAGDRVVHGIHALIWALDQLAAAGLPIADTAKLDVQFTKFIHLDTLVALRLAERTETLLRAELAIGALPVMTVLLQFGARKDRGEYAVPPGAPVRAAVGGVADSPWPSEMEGMAGWLDVSPNKALVVGAFPQVCGALGTVRVLGLIRLSYLVGMICPGLHSIFAATTLLLVNDGGDERCLGFRVAVVRDDLGVVRMEVSGCGLSGTVRAMLRKPPVASPDMEAIIARVPAGRFAGSRALVVGGSRGLGATTAKILAAGGAAVTITYARGRTDAEQVSREISEACGAMACSVLPLDVGRDVASQLRLLPGNVTHLYYFATPHIFEQAYELYSSSKFARFRQIYIDGFYDTCLALLARSGGGRLSIFYPSSVAVESRPAGMVEYAMAKAAGEILCAEMSQAVPEIRILVSRIPRTLTDQTATVARVENADPLDVLLPLILQTQVWEGNSSNAPDRRHDASPNRPR